MASGQPPGPEMTSRRRPIIRSGVALALLCLPSLRAVAQPAPAARQPNIVIILADDLGYGDLRSYNADSRIPTPHLDRLAAEGMRFTDAHSPSGVCTPTRYGLLTGRYAWRTTLKKGVLNGYSPL
ncbi:MAG: sulfatase-like hydrolase/transferase, partial [Acidobacteriota bacterium]|nr:sulfatase-like hydrolase/transferase [Acidobacteriota bacterium]